VIVSSVLTLFHHPMLAACRFVRLAFGEYGEELVLIEEKPWARRKEFLALNRGSKVRIRVPQQQITVIAFGRDGQACS